MCLSMCLIWISLRFTFICFIESHRLNDNSLNINDLVNIYMLYMNCIFYCIVVIPELKTLCCTVSVVLLLRNKLDLFIPHVQIFLLIPSSTSNLTGCILTYSQGSLLNCFHGHQIKSLYIVALQHYVIQGYCYQEQF